MITQEKKEYIQLLFSEGKSKAEISRITGVSTPTIKRIVSGMVQKDEMIGRIFGRLKVMSIAPKDPTLASRCLRYRCICECGNELIVNGGSLRSNHTTSCGCARKGSNIKDISGQKFGLLTVIQWAGESAEDRRAMWLCKCECGNETTINSHLLLSGHVTSCGCKKESLGEIKVTSVLNELEYNYCKQYRLSDCRLDKPLPFDFAIFENNKLIALIEYQGDIHYHTTGGWNTQERLIENQKRDKIKQDYCKEHNIPLFIISYWDYEKIDADYIKKGIYSGLQKHN